MNNKSLSIIQVSQFIEVKADDPKGVYIGLWQFSDFIKSVKFTNREPIKYNIFGHDFESDFSKKYPEFNHDYYQRLVNDDRTKKVINFLLNQLSLSFKQNQDPLITFPTTLILNGYVSEAQNKEEYITGIQDLNIEDYNEEVGLFIDNERRSVILPELNVMLIVDGQHRIAGLLSIYEAIKSIIGDNDNSDYQINKKLIEYAKRKLENENFPNLNKLKESVERFQFTCTLLLDFDIWEQGKVFADVNFNQKPVNKSLYYDIFGSYPDPERNDLFLAHYWTALLNSTDGSPFRNKIKMLGNGSGFFSQAFFVESLFPLLRKNGVWNYVIADYISSGVKPQFIPIFLSNYFLAIKELYIEYWPLDGEKASAYKNILFKTTGLGSLIKLINLVFPLVDKELYSDENQLKAFIKNLFISEITVEKLNNRIDNYIQTLKSDTKLSVDVVKNKIISLEQDKNNIKPKISGEYYFSKNGGFAKGAGKGLQDKLFKELAFDLGLIGSK